MADLSKVVIPDTVTKIDVVFSWEQPQAKGLMGRAKAFANRTDVDVSVISFKGTVPVDYVDPKEHPYAHGGRIVHSGDVKKGTGEGGGETVKLELGNMRTEDSDIDAFAIVASCATGNFSKIAGASARIIDTSGPEPKQLAVVRFDVTSERNGALLALIRKTPHGWVLWEQQASGNATSWRDLAGLARHRL